MIQKFIININNQDCELILTSKKMKNIRMSVVLDDDTQKIIIKVNGYRINYDIAMKMINSHINWVNKRINELTCKIKQFDLDDVNNFKKIYLYGILYDITITNEKNNHLKIIDNKLYYYSKTGIISNINKNIEFIRCEYLSNITNLFNKYKKIFNINPELSYKSLKSKHGYCLYKENKIVLSTHLVHIPLYAIEYVIVHEFCHFIEPNHSKKFYNCVYKYCKDYKERIKVLKQYNILTR